MEIIPTSNRIHPLIAGAAISVMVVSLLGAAAIAGFIPSSHGSSVDTARFNGQPVAGAPISGTNLQTLAPTIATREVTEHKTVVHHQYVHHARPTQVSQVEPSQQYSPAPVYQQTAPVAQNSPLGIGVGAVIGGLLGSQIGGGKGRTLATLAGAVGGGYVGNEIAKKNQ